MEAHNSSSDSTDSLKENQPENNRSSNQITLNDSALSKTQPLAAPLDSSLTTGGLRLQPTTSCNDSAFNHSSDEESFADCPAFNSPAVNKQLLNLGRSNSTQARQSLGLDALANAMGKFKFDSSISANSTVDIAVTDDLVPEEQPPQVNRSSSVAYQNEEEVLEVVDCKETVNLNVESPTVVPSETDDRPLPPPPPPISEDEPIECYDVEMMSVVMENGVEGDDDYSNIALPEDAEEVFPDPPPPESESVIAPEASYDAPQLNVTKEVTVEDNCRPIVVTLNDSCQMDIDEYTSPVKDKQVQHKPAAPTEIDPSPIVEIIPPVAEEQQSAEQPPVIEKAKSMDSAQISSQGFKMPTMLRRSLNNQPQAFVSNPFDGATTGISDNKKELFFSSTDFDFLQNKETATSLSTAIKDSVLLKFDPLINQPVIVDSVAQPQGYPLGGEFNLETRDGSEQYIQSLSGHKQFSVEESVASSSILEEEGDLVNEEDSLLEVFGVVRSQQPQSNSSELLSETSSQRPGQENCPISKLVDVTMSLVDVINDSNLSASVANRSVDKEISVINTNTINCSTISTATNLSNINLEDVECSRLRMSVDGGQQQHHNGESKIRNERYEDMERKLKEMEEKEEVLLKRLSEKEKQNTKMGHIVEEYERSIAELMKERAITKEEYEKRCLDLETERNANYQHLSSLETTFSDLHVKYERSKQQMEALKKSEEALLADKRQSAEQAAMQEQRYDKLKTHAMQQMEIANLRLRDESAQANQEVSRLRALLKKEEITRCSLQEQLNQKTREIDELMKIWDELKSDQ